MMDEFISIQIAHENFKEENLQSQFPMQSLKELPENQKLDLEK